jgi:hypothetical protein
LPAEFVEAVARALAAALLREMAEKPEPQPQTEENDMADEQRGLTVHALVTGSLVAGREQRDRTG